MDLGIRGKVAIVTACSTGLGASIASRLAEEGCRLVLLARTQSKLESLAAVLRKQHGVDVLSVVGDLAEATSVRNLIAETIRMFGAPQILVLNTGRPPMPLRRVLDETDDQRWHDAHRTQLLAAMLAVRNIVPLMVEQGWGRVIGVTSASVKQPMPNHALSTVYRAGVTGMLKHLANEVAARGVTVNTVCPASIASDALTSSYNIVERIKIIPVGRLGTPQEFAAAVAFLASDLAGFITGASLNVDGGMVGSLY
jgi:3-oxoacyl-[acyl-carrier protein] reductase